MPLPDNRIRLSSTLIDFTNDVGTTSQDHDTFPDAGQQARYDWMRMYLIGLLSNQSSFDEPSQYREGTTWFDLNTLSLKIRRNNEWVSISDAIAVSTTDEVNNDSTVFTLTEWYEQASEAIASSEPEITFSGSSANDDVTSIPIPESLRSGLFSDSRPFVYKNGVLIDPRLVSLDPGEAPTNVALTSTVSLMSGDTFTIVIKRIPSDRFYVPEVTV